MAIKQGREYRALQDFSLVPRDEGSKEYRVRGTAIVFNSPTVLWECDGVEYKEIIDRHAFDECDMSDVIFNGTQKRKPLSYCEVSLVFDNDDHALAMEAAEVMVTRRVYRNGESEYYLNRTACRLKDVVDLFRDTGIGIPEEERAKIFDRFYKVDTFTQGTGLGLPICKNIAEQLGGRIGVDSAVGAGSCFWVEIPAGK